VAEAAEVSGISAEPVRGRIRRGTLPLEREGGTAYVLLNAPLDDRTTSDQPTGRSDLLIAELQDRVRSLEGANRENWRIIAALPSRLPAIEAPLDERGSSEVGAYESERAEREPRSDVPGTHEGVQRPWWRRVSGG